MTLNGEPVYLAHFGSCECFHKREEQRLQHPPAADVDNLSGDVLGFFGCEKGDGGGHVLDGRRTANGKTCIAHAPRFVEAEFLLVNTGRVDDVYGNSVLRLFESERTGKRDDRSFRGS